MSGDGRRGLWRRWQRAGTHAAPRPTWPAAVPPAAAAARCPLTSGGECGAPGHGEPPLRAQGVNGRIVDPSNQARRSDTPRPVHASAGHWGPRSVPCCTQNWPEQCRAPSCSWWLSHPPPGPSHPFPPVSPLPSLPLTSCKPSSHSLHTGKLTPSPRREQTSHPSALHRASFCGPRPC